MTKFLHEEWMVWWIAVQFLTRIPAPRGVAFSEARFRAATRYYPLVGALVGGIGGSVYWMAAPGYGPMLAALLATAATVWVTGAFHEDGLADSCDALGGGATREHVLEILRDSRLGTYGVVGLGLGLAIKVAALTEMEATVVPPALIVGHALSRGMAVWVIATSSYVRAEGLAKPVAAGIKPVDLYVAGWTCALLGLALVWNVGFSGLAGLGGALFGGWLMRWEFERRMGGYTGDGLGAVQQCAEIGFLLGMALDLSSTW